MKKEKEICASFAVTLPTANASHWVGVWSSHSSRKGADSTGRYSESERETPHSHNVYSSILLQLFYPIIIVVNLLLCLIYKLNFILSM